MNLRVQQLLRLHRLYKEAGEDGGMAGGASGKDGQGDSGGSDGAGAGTGDGGEDDKSGAGDKGGKSGEADGSGKGGDNTQLSDADAKILRDLMKHKGRARELEGELSAVREQLARFEGLDPQKMRELLKKEEDAERAAAEARGEYDRIIKQMGERHLSEKQLLEQRTEELARSNSALAQQIAELTVGQAFGASQFVAKDLTLTPTKARVIYGAHFEFKDGKVVGYDKPAGASERTVLVDSAGEPLSFDEALRALVNKDPERDHMLRTSAKSGAGSASSNSKASRKAAEESAARAASQLRGADKISAGLKALASQGR